MKKRIASGVLMLFAGGALLAQLPVTNGAVAKRSDAQLLDVLAAKLSLSETQQETIASIMRRHGETRVEEEAIWDKQHWSVSEKRKAILADYGEETKQIRAVMSSAQQNRFATYIKVDLPADRALGMFVAQYGLNGEQSGRLQVLLTTFYTKQLASQQGKYDAQNLEQDFEAKMRPIFTASQRALYQQSPLIFFGTNYSTFDRAAGPYEPSMPSLGRLNDATISDITLGITHIN